MSILDKYWYIACRSRTLRKKPYGFRIMDRRLVVFRQKDGTPAALEDRCLHRGTPLSHGKVCDSQLQCPYHGWRYDGEGEIKSIPALPSVPELAGIKNFLCIEQDGYIWICLDQEPVQDAPLCFENLNKPGWTSFHMKTRFSASVEACLENFLDCPHATFVHNKWFRSPTGRRVDTIVQTLEDGAVAEYFEEPREKSVVWWFLSPGRSTMKHTDRFIAPATSKVDYHFSNGRHYTITSSCTPVSDQLTEVYTVISFKIAKFGPLVRLFFEPLSHIIIRQDVVMLDATQENNAASNTSQITITQADLLAPHIGAWRSALKNGHNPPAPGKEEKIELRL